MTKMNRRDYLMQMGAGAAAFATLGQQVFAQTRRRGRRRRPIAKSQQSRPTFATAAATGRRQFTNWPTTNVLPDFDSSPVILIFGGLFGFLYNGTGDVRYHPGNHHHPMIRIWRAGNSTPEDIPLTGRCKRILVEINRVQSDVNFYEENPNQPFTNRMADSFDFRWLLDLDSEDFYADYNFKLLDKCGIL